MRKCAGCDGSVSSFCISRVERFFQELQCLEFFWSNYDLLARPDDLAPREINDHTFKNTHVYGPEVRRTSDLRTRAIRSSCSSRASTPSLFPHATGLRLTLFELSNSARQTRRAASFHLCARLKSKYARFMLPSVSMCTVRTFLPLLK